MKLCLRIALLVACLAGWTVTQDGFDLADAFDDDPKPATPKPQPEKPKVNAGGGGGVGGDLDLSDAFGPEEPEKPKKPAAGDNDNDMGFDLADALGPDPNPKPDPPAVVPPKSGEGGGSFDDSDLMGVGEGDYKPDGGRGGAGGRAADDPADNAADQPQDLYLLWGRVLTMLNANMPDEVHIWIANIKETMKPLLERAMELLETIQ